MSEYMIGNRHVSVDEFVADDPQARAALAAARELLLDDVEIDACVCYAVGMITLDELAAVVGDARAHAIDAIIAA